MTVFTCEDDFESMMTCIYDAWASKKGHENVRLLREPIVSEELFCEYVHVDAEKEKAVKVARSIRRKISEQAYQMVCYAALSEEEALDAIYRFLILGFAYGAKVTSMLSCQPVMRMLELQRNVGNEAHHFREFARFTSIEGKVYVCHIEPKNNVLLPVAHHFQDRMPSEHWMILDDIRQTAAVHPQNEAFYIRRLTKGEADRLAKTEEREDEYCFLWRTFFEAIGIAQRENPACQRNLFPLWMRKHATEFMGEKTEPFSLGAPSLYEEGAVLE